MSITIEQVVIDQAGQVISLVLGVDEVEILRVGNNFSLIKVIWRDKVLGADFSCIQGVARVRNIRVANICQSWKIIRILSD